MTPRNRVLIAAFLTTTALLLFHALSPPTSPDTERAADRDNVRG